MLKGNKFRLYPTEEQKILLEKHFGCTRLVYNLALEAKLMAYSGNKVSVSWVELINQVVDLKKGYTWLKEVNSQALQMSIRNLDSSFTNFFKHKKGFPKFKSKHDKQTFTCPQGIKIDSSKQLLFLFKFKEGIPIVLHRKLKGKIKSATISKEPTGKYLVSILTDTDVDLPLKKEVKEQTTIGIDMGIKDFVVLSDGTKVSNPRYLNKLLARLKYEDSRLGKMRHRNKDWKTSKRYQKQRIKVAKLHEKVANCRRDFLHKLSTSIAKSFDTVCMENLKVANMVKNHCLARHIQDCGWGAFKEMVRYKCEWYGKNFILIDTFAPSSKTCSCCGAINKNLTLDQRFWTCEVCGIEHDRDINGAVNVKSFGLEKWRQELSC